MYLPTFFLFFVEFVKVFMHFYFKKFKPGW